MGNGSGVMCVNERYCIIIIFMLIYVNFDRLIYLFCYVSELRQQYSKGAKGGLVCRSVAVTAFNALCPPT